MKKIFCLLMASIALAGCEKEVPGTDGSDNTGTLVLTSLSRSGVFVEPTRAGGITRSEEDEVDVGAFAIAIVNSGGEVTKSWPQYSDITGDIALMPGEYTLRAGTADPRDAAFEYPVFSGSQSFTIREKQTTNISVECKLTNMKVTIEIAESFTNEIEDYQITVMHTDNADNHLVFHAGEARVSGYFSVAPLTMQVRGTRKFDGSAIQENYPIADVAAQDHHILRLSAEEVGHIGDERSGLEITVDYTLNDEEHNIIIPFEDEPDAITITGEGIGSPLTLTDDQAGVTPVQVAFTVPEGIAHLWVTVPTAVQAILDERAGSTVVSPFDLADLPDGLEEVLVELGMMQAGATVAGSRNVTLVLTSLMGEVAAPLPGGDPETYEFTVKAVDALSEELEKTVTIIREAGAATVDPDDPTITRAETGKTMEETFTQAEAAEAQVSVMIAAPRGIENLFVEIQSPALQELLSGMDIPSSFDLANMTDEVAAFFGPGGGAQLITEPVKDKQECSFDISGFMGALAAVAGDTEGEDVFPFRIEVVDAEDVSAEEILGITITD